jgi:hypothetical protein
MTEPTADTVLAAAHAGHEAVQQLPWGQTTPESWEDISLRRFDEYMASTRAALLSALPHIEADVRARIAEEIRAAIDDMGDPHPGWREGLLTAATIAEGKTK